jgi:alkylhydroperoxidase family enzyme
MEQRLNYAKAAPGAYRQRSVWNSISSSADSNNRYCTLSNCAPRRSTAAPSVWIRTRRICAPSRQSSGSIRWTHGGNAHYYSERERAALTWTEAVTLITNGHVPDGVYETVRPHFSEKELSDLTFTVATINSWNRLSIAGRTTPGTYQPTQTHKARKAG